jgi:hypothetical protein
MLPADEVLDMNVKDLATFKKLLVREVAFQSLAPVLAPAIHESYTPLAKRGNVNNVPYEDLSPEIKADNLAAAMRIPWLLGLVGLRVTASVTDVPLDEKLVMEILGDPVNLEMLAEEEHDLWMMEKLANGWQYGPRDDVKLLHDCLVPYAKLGDDQKPKDRANILGIPERVALAGFRIVARPD